MLIKQDIMELMHPDSTCFNPCKINRIVLGVLPWLSMVHLSRVPHKIREVEEELAVVINDCVVAKHLMDTQFIRHGHMSGHKQIKMAISR